jgi:mannosyltransferase
MTIVEHRAPDVGAGGTGAGVDDTPSSWRLPVAAVLVVGFLASIVTVGRSSFSLDESLTATLAYSPWHIFTHSVLHREANMSLYYVAVRLWDGAWSALLGHATGPETVVRTFSVVASVGALAVVMAVTRRLFDRRTALIGGLLLAVDPLVVLFAQDARGYALSLLLVSASSALFVRGIGIGVDRDVSGDRAGDRGEASAGDRAGDLVALPGWGLWVAYAPVSALAAYANFWAALVPLAHAASLAFLPPGRAPWRRLVPTAVGLGVLLFPLALLIHATDSSGVNWAAGSSAGKVFTTARADIPHAVIDLAVVLVVVVLVALGAVVRRAPKTRFVQDHWPVVFTVCWLVVPVAAVVLLSLAYKPLLVVRYLVICLPPFVMLVAYGLTRLRGSRVTAAVAALVVASGVGVGLFIAHGSPEDWRGAVTSVADRSQPGDGLVVFAPYTRIPFQWYVPQHRDLVTNVHPLFPAGSWATNGMRFDTSITLTAGTIEHDVTGYHRVWLVESQQELYPAENTALLSGLRAAGLEPAGTRTFHGVEVVLYAEPA